MQSTVEMVGSLFTVKYSRNGRLRIHAGDSGCVGTAQNEDPKSEQSEVDVHVPIPSIQTPVDYIPVGFGDRMERTKHIEDFRSLPTTGLAIAVLYLLFVQGPLNLYPFFFPKWPRWIPFPVNLLIIASCNSYSNKRKLHSNNLPPFDASRLPPHEPSRMVRIKSPFDALIVATSRSTTMITTIRMRYYFPEVTWLSSLWTSVGVAGLLIAVTAGVVTFVIPARPLSGLRNKDLKLPFWNPPPERLLSRTNPLTTRRYPKRHWLFGGPVLLSILVGLWLTPILILLKYTSYLSSINFLLCLSIAFIVIWMISITSIVIYLISEPLGGYSYPVWRSADLDSMGQNSASFESNSTFDTENASESDGVDTRVSATNARLLLPNTRFNQCSYSIDQLYRYLNQSSHGEVPLHGVPSSYPFVNEGQAIIHAIELHKYDAWIHRRHEFLVLKMRYLDEDFIIHIDRTWEASGTSKIAYYLPLGFGSHKPVERFEQVTFFKPGDDEQSSRKNTRIVYCVSFGDKPVYLWQLAHVLHREFTYAPRYSFLGPNCWAWSRLIMRILISNELGHRDNRNIGITLFKGDLEEKVDQSYLEQVLDDQWAFAVGNTGPFASHRLGLGARHPTPSQWAAFNRYIRSHFGLQGYTNRYYRQIYYRNAICRIAVDATYRKEVDVTEIGAPHSFNHTPFYPSHFAVEGHEVYPINSLCGPGEFLYLLTPPLWERNQIRFIKRLQVSLDIPGISSRNQSCAWAELGIVRKDPYTGTSHCIGPRLVLETQQKIDDRYLWNFWPSSTKYPLAYIRTGDQLGLWIRKTCIGELEVHSAIIYVTHEHGIKSPIWWLASLITRWYQQLRYQHWELQDEILPNVPTKNPLNLCRCYGNDSQIFQRQDTFLVTNNLSFDSERRETTLVILRLRITRSRAGYYTSSHLEYYLVQT